MSGAQSDDDRYVQHLQEQLMAHDGWGPMLDALRREPAPTPPDHTRSSELEDMTRRWNEFKPTTVHDLPSTHAIFQPILNDITLAASELGIPAVAEIRLVTATDMAAGPTARPAAGLHYLFAGPGTSSFCNYWAKVIAWHIDALRRAIGTRPMVNRIDTRAALELDSGSLRTALGLAIDYAKHGSTVGHGVVEIPQPANGLRLELLTSMETFVLAHEYSHFVAEEHGLGVTGHELELFCDQLGLQIARNAPSQRDNWSNFAGAGAVLFFAAAGFCSRLEALWLGDPITGDSSHPSLAERVNAVATNAIGQTDPDQRQAVETYLIEFLRILDDFFAEGLEIAQAAWEQSGTRSSKPNGRRSI